MDRNWMKIPNKYFLFCYTGFPPKPWLDPEARIPASIKLHQKVSTSTFLLRPFSYDICTTTFLRKFWAFGTYRKIRSKFDRFNLLQRKTLLRVEVFDRNFLNSKISKKSKSAAQKTSASDIPVSEISLN